MSDQVCEECYKLELAEGQAVLEYCIFDTPSNRNKWGWARRRQNAHRLTCTIWIANNKPPDIVCEECERLRQAAREAQYHFSRMSALIALDAHRATCPIWQAKMSGNEAEK